MVQTTINDKILTGRSDLNRNNGKTAPTEDERNAAPRTRPEALPPRTSIDAGSARLLQQSNDPDSSLQVENSENARRLTMGLRYAFEHSPDLAVKAHSGITRSLTESALATVNA